VHGLDGPVGVGLFIQRELIGILLKPSVELNHQVALIHLVLDVVLHLLIVLSGKSVVCPQVMVKLLKNYIELFFKVFRLLRLRRLWIFELSRDVEGVLKVFQDVGFP
jgi:hypothetical protein